VPKTAIAAGLLVGLDAESRLWVAFLHKRSALTDNHGMASNVRTVWLFVRGDESIYIMRTELRFRVYGPDGSEHFHEFGDMAPLTEFLRWYTAALTADGWVFRPDVDRRLQIGPSPASGNRRRSRSSLVH
jgi:hypothetical protein